LSLSARLLATSAVSFGRKDPARGQRPVAAYDPKDKMAYFKDNVLTQEDAVRLPAGGV
jgi:hypothetical protein